MSGPSSPPPRPAALLLTGGVSRRMGTDKAALVIDGDRLANRIAHMLELVAEPAIEVGPGFTTLPHTREDPPGSGPLAAVAAGMSALQRRHLRGPVLVVATDLPGLTSGALQRLADHPVPSPEHCVVPRDADGRAQPLCARYSASALVRAQELLAGGRRSMKALLEQVPVIWLDVADRDVLFDVDTPDDVAAFLDRAGARDLPARARRS